MDDFNNNEDFYKSIEPTDVDDMSDLATFLMLVTNSLKQVDYENNIKSGHELMMKIFNMTNLSLEQTNEDALNVIMALISHIYAMLMFVDDRRKYFEYFDEAVIYPILNRAK